WPDVLEPRLPVLAHRHTRKFVVLGARRIREAAIDEMDDRDLALLLGPGLEQRVVGIVTKARRELLHQAPHRMAYGLDLLDAIGVEARLARILNVFRALLHLVEVDR